MHRSAHHHRPQRYRSPGMAVFFCCLLAIGLTGCGGGGGSGGSGSSGSSSSSTSSGSSSSSSGGSACYTPNDAGMSPSAAGGSVPFALQLGVGWNLGNSLEAIGNSGPGDETAWGNPVVTQALINAVKAAGFDTIRIPVAWSKFSDPDSFTIDSAWLDRVEEVVNYALNAGMYVILNEHWDGGWLNHPFYANQTSLNNRLSIMWTQIANHFRAYDNHLLFAGTNEVMNEDDYSTPTVEYYTVQNSFNQTFVDAVRATGDGNGNADDGNANADRYLIVQGFNTNIDHTVNFAEIPDDTAVDHLLMEVHYYDPYNFTLNASSNITQWGCIATDPNAVESWANESWVDAQFQAMKTNFIDQGIGVILGEYGVISRQTVPNHETYRVYWNEYITQAAINHGLVPVYWDNGASGDNSMVLFDRNNSNPLYPDIIDAIVGAGD